MIFPVERLLVAQFPQWAHLPITPVEPGGWDNRTFRLGDTMTVRLSHGGFRGAPLLTYDDETRRTVAALCDRIDGAAALALWDTALDATFTGPPVWFHGDVAEGNLLVRDGRLTAVIDFGCTGVGDSACDLAIAWTLLHGESREAFRAALDVDDAMWLRGRGWVLWKALITLAGSDDPGRARRLRGDDHACEALTSDAGWLGPTRPPERVYPFGWLHSRCTRITDGMAPVGLVLVMQEVTVVRSRWTRSALVAAGACAPLAAGVAPAHPDAPAPAPSPASHCSETAATAYGWGSPTRESDVAGTTLPPDWHPYGPEPGHNNAGTRTADAITVADGAVTITGSQDGTTGASPTTRRSGRPTDTSHCPPRPMNMTMQLDDFGDASGPTAMHMDWARQWALPESEPAEMSLAPGDPATGQPSDYPQRAPRRLG